MDYRVMIDGLDEIPSAKRIPGRNRPPILAEWRRILWRRRQRRRRLRRKRQIRPEGNPVPGDVGDGEADGGDGDGWAKLAD